MNLVTESLVKGNTGLSEDVIPWKIETILTTHILTYTANTIFNNIKTGANGVAGTAYPSVEYDFTQFFCCVVLLSLQLSAVFGTCRSLFVLWAFSLWSLHCLSFDVRLLITPLISANLYYIKIIIYLGILMSSTIFHIRWCSSCWLTVGRRASLTLWEHLSSSPVSCVVLVARSFVICIVSCRWLIVLFLLVIALSVFLQLTASDYHFGIFQLFYWGHFWHYNVERRQHSVYSR